MREGLPRDPLLDPATGALNRVWYLFLLELIGAANLSTVKVSTVIGQTLIIKKITATKDGE